MLTVSAIIPHAGGIEILRECLNSLRSVEGIELEVVIVDNGSGENPQDWGVSAFANVQVLRYECKLGFAAACNRGVEASKGEFSFLFNNDAVADPGSIRILAEALADDPMIGAVQPKILSYFDRTRFDYSSACGGLMDSYGVPFARGRIFDSVEEDHGQYDCRAEIFWGAGAALMIRRSLYLEAGGLEEPFFAHMEEIDFLWRLQLMGKRVMVIPEAIVLHRGAVTIRTGSFLKLYLNHRNSLAMLIRNYSFASLIKYFPVRLAMDAVWALFCLIRLDFVKFLAVSRAGIWIWLSLPYLITGRRRVQRLRRVNDNSLKSRIYNGSIAYQYYGRGIRRAKELKCEIEPGL